MKQMSSFKNKGELAKIIKKVSCYVAIFVYSCSTFSVSFAGTFYKRSSLTINEVFGEKLGSRISDEVGVASTSEGLIFVSFNPSDPFLPFREYYKMATPKTRTVVMVQALNPLGDVKYNAIAVFDKYVMKIEDYYGEKMIVKNVEGREDDEYKIKRAFLLDRHENVLLLELVKVDSMTGYLMRLQLIDFRSAKRIEDRVIKSENAKLPGVFGVCFGDKVSEEKCQKSPKGALLEFFKPEKSFMSFEMYMKEALPKTHRVYRISGGRTFRNSVEALVCYDRICSLFKTKYNREVIDTTGGKTVAPYGDGDVILKLGMISFSNQRVLLVECRREQGGVFRVFIHAQDMQLSGLLDSELRFTQKESYESDLNAL